MRRRDREIANRREIDAIIRSAQVCRIAFADGNVPYVVPVSFGYDGAALYVHTAKTGRKLEFIAANNRVCFELEANVSIQSDESDPCAWTFAFESVIGYGTISELTETADKVAGLNHIMVHYSGRDWEIDDVEISRTRVWQIHIDSVTGKRSAEKPGT